MATDIFVGREEYLARAHGVLASLFSSSPSDPTQFISITGPGGIGKSQLATRLRNMAKSLGAVTTELMDLQATPNRADLLLLASLARPFSNDFFSRFYDALDRYYAADYMDRSKYYGETISSFVEDARMLSATEPLVVLLDTLEAVQGSHLETWLLDVLMRIGGRTAIVVAGRTVRLPKSMHTLDLRVKPLSLPEAEQLARLLYQDRGVDFDLEEETTQRMHQLSQGYPILFTLAIELILEHVRPDDVSEVTPSRFEREMISHLRHLPPIQQRAIMLMSVADRRFTPEIMSMLTGQSIYVCTGVCSQVSSFSFVKVRPEDGVLSLHDEMRRLVEQYVDLPEETGLEVLRQLVRQYYDPAIADTASTQARQVLTAEKLSYQLSIDPEEGIRLFDREMRGAIDSLEFDYGNLLLDEVAHRQLPSHLQRYVDLAKAELALEQYRPGDAQLILKGLTSAFDVHTHAEEYCRVLEGLGASIINPCTIARADPFEAAQYWQASLDVCRQSGLSHRIPKILFELGNTYGATGEWNKAHAAYDEAVTIAESQGNTRLAGQVLDEMNYVYRLEQNVVKAQPCIARSFEIKTASGNDKGLGVTYFYMGSTHRDLDDFTEAAKYFQLADVVLQEIGDAYNLCRLYADIAWTAFLERDFAKVEEYSSRSRELATRGQFGTEMSESWHVEYEMLMVKGEIDRAYYCLDQALYFSKRYNDIYMILDCLHHDAQRAFRQGRYDDIPRVIEEMMSFERKGCGIHVFRGRATVVHGDARFMLGDLAEAVDLWEDGLTVVALYGNSRTNVELFDDILDQRLENIRNALIAVGPSRAQRLKMSWIGHGLSGTFPSVIQLCDSILASQLDEAAQSK